MRTEIDRHLRIGRTRSMIVVRVACIHDKSVQNVLRALSALFILFPLRQGFVTYCLYRITVRKTSVEKSSFIVKILVLKELFHS